MRVDVKTVNSIYSVLSDYFYALKFTGTEHAKNQSLLMGDLEIHSREVEGFKSVTIFKDKDVLLKTGWCFSWQEAYLLVVDALFKKV